jgi:hypothetical protein
MYPTNPHPPQQPEEREPVDIFGSASPPPPLNPAIQQQQPTHTQPIQPQQEQQQAQPLANQDQHPPCPPGGHFYRAPFWYTAKGEKIWPAPEITQRQLEKFRQQQSQNQEVANQGFGFNPAPTQPTTQQTQPQPQQQTPAPTPPGPQAQTPPQAPPVIRGTGEAEAGTSQGMVEEDTIWMIMVKKLKDLEQENAGLKKKVLLAKKALE